MASSWRFSILYVHFDAAIQGPKLTVALLAQHAYEHVIPEAFTHERTESKAAAAASLAEIKYDVASGDRRLVVVIPVNNPSPALCKTMLSAVAMGYPMPIIINWGISPEEAFPGRENVGSHQLKISGLLKFLDEMTHENTPEEDRLSDDDLIVMVDAFDIWFQTPPDVLIRRYHESNRRMNERLMAQWKGKPEDMPLKQSIVISATKRCWPDDGPLTMHCSELPESDLPEDLYGDLTDKDAGEFWATLHNVRPRYINTGNVMGPVGDLRRYVRRVNEKLESTVANHDGYYFKSDQAFFGNILGEQEIYRKWLLKQDGDLPFMLNRDLEHHVGLDYSQNLCLPTTNEEDDGEFVALGDSAHIKKKSESLHVDPVRVAGVPEDIAMSPNPLDILPDVNPTPAWADLPLYVDYFTTSVPAMLHHNTNRGEGKARIITWWDRPWFFPYLRDLVLARTRPDVEREPLGTFNTNDGNVTYWPPQSNATQKLPRIFKAGEASKGLPTGEWEEMCLDPKKPKVHWSIEVFRDGRGGLAGEGAEARQGLE